MERAQCIICRKQDIGSQFTGDDGWMIFFSCPICGRYEVSDDFGFGQVNKNHLASFMVYKGFRKKRGLLQPTEYRYYTTRNKEKCDEYAKQFEEEIIDNGHPVHLGAVEIENWYPNSFADKIDNILLYFNDKCEYIGQEITLEKEEILGCFFVEQYEYDGRKYIIRDESVLQSQIDYMKNYLIQQEYISNVERGSAELNEYVFSILPKGYARIDELQKDVTRGVDAFVAMQFGEETLELRDAIRRGISDAGYNAIFIDEVEHNEFITPELLKHIKDCKFLVVDLSHQNNGAYFEEGYAFGLGRPVIQLCKAGVELHFDIRQKNTIFWDKESDIPEKLKNRIIATID